jgi:hypothetical protein
MIKASKCVDLQVDPRCGGRGIELNERHRHICRDVESIWHLRRDAKGHRKGDRSTSLHWRCSGCDIGRDHSSGLIKDAGAADNVSSASLRYSVSGRRSEGLCELVATRHSADFKVCAVCRREAAEVPDLQRSSQTS